LSSGSLGALFRPERVAVIGASSSPEKMGFQIFRNIVEAGFRGEILPVNPKGETILGRQSLKSAADIPPGTDLAVLIIPAKLVPGTLLQLGERNVRAAIVISGGFAESGEEGAALQAELARNAARCGIRVVGPNCQGVNYPYHGLCASWPLITRRGGIAFVSQSGTVGAAMIDWASEDRLGFSAFVSMGNRADVDEADLIEFFAEDPNTKVVSLYIEGVKDAGKFLAALRKCRKPVVVFKAGRTERGRKAAESHTRSLAGRDEIYDAVFRQFGVHRASSLEDLYDFSKALAYLPPLGTRMLIVTSSGSAIIATDVAEEEDSVSPLPPDLASRLKEMLPAHCIVEPLTSRATRTPRDTGRSWRRPRDITTSSCPSSATRSPGRAASSPPGAASSSPTSEGRRSSGRSARCCTRRGSPCFPLRSGRSAPFPATRASTGRSSRGRGNGGGKRKRTGAGRFRPPIDAPSFGIGISRGPDASRQERRRRSPRPALGFRRRKMNSPDVTHKSDVGGVVLGARTRRT
jgi:acyl-CoA synthetase (NDP forming)